MKYIYFLFSKKAYEDEKKIFDKLNKIYKPKKVLFNGRWVEFTHKTSNPSELQNLISDSILVAKIKESEVKIL